MFLRFILIPMLSLFLVFFGIPNSVEAGIDLSSFAGIEKAKKEAKKRGEKIKNTIRLRRKVNKRTSRRTRFGNYRPSNTSSVSVVGYPMIGDNKVNNVLNDFIEEPVRDAPKTVCFSKELWLCVSNGSNKSSDGVLMNTRLFIKCSKPEPMDATSCVGIY